MIPLDPPHRHATAADADALAELVDMAGEGLPFYLWTKLAEGGRDPWEVGRERARRESGAFSYRNAVVREEQGRVVAALVGYPIADELTPSDYDGMPPLFVPMQQLEDQCAGTWYVNVVATSPEFRGKGHGRDLLDIAERLAADEGKSGLSLIVADTNVGARRLYERLGYVETARRPMVKNGWQHPGKEWVLMIKRPAARTDVGRS